MIRPREIIATSLICSQLHLKSQPNDERSEDKINQIQDNQERREKASLDSFRVDPEIIEVVYNQYFQNGNNSAVTGGIGTEKLIVYGPSLKVTNKKDKNTFQIQTGVDIISSASADNIDFIPSSPSRIDPRGYVDVNIGKFNPRRNLNLEIGSGLSLESDYFSFKTQIGANKKLNPQSEIGFVFQLFLDDLRWGLGNPGYYRLERLIYPAELRFKEWHDETHRHTKVVKMSYSQVMNKRNVLGVFFDFTHQEGLLATPFHRIYFSDYSIGVEQLPSTRQKGSLAVRLNSFVGGNVILKNSINPYMDSFGINSVSIENQTAIKLTPEFILLPGFRYYSQTSARYFKPYEEHDSGTKYHTSDYDLSAFETYTMGVGFKKHYNSQSSKRTVLRTWMLRYSHMIRTDGLKAHIISTSVMLNKKKKAK